MVAHAIVAVGATGGGLELLRRITERLPRNCGATVFVAMHSGVASFLPEILSWHGKLPVEFAREGAPIKAGRIYVAPPDHHMCVGADYIRLNQEPRVHNVRPEIDPMFASVARPTASGSWASFSAEPVVLTENSILARRARSGRLSRNDRVRQPVPPHPCLTV